MLNKKIVTSLFTIGLFLVFFIISCDKKIGRYPVITASPPLSVSACDTITYNKHIKPIIDGECVSCHGSSAGSGGVGLTSYGQVKAKAEEGRIKARVIDGPSFMPPQGKLPQAKIDLIQC